MKVASCLLGLLIAAPVWGIPTQDVESDVREVTVYADRARVTRTAQVRLHQGPTVFAFAELPGWIDEGSVRVGLEPTDAGQILGVQLHRTFLARPSDDEFRAAEEAVQEMSDQIAALDDEARVLDAEAEHISSLRAFSLDKLPRDAATRRIEIAELEESVAFVADSLRRIATARRQLEVRRRDFEPELAVRQRRLAELRQRSQLDQRTVMVTVSDGGASTGPASATISVTYMIPGATWEPAHELRTAVGAAANQQRVTLTSFAHIRQTTGEDWSNALVSLSTQRSNQRLRIPEIEALRLGGGRSLSRLVTTSTDSFGSATASYVQQNAAFFDAGNADVATQKAYRENQAVQLDNARRVAEVFQQLEQRGTTSHFAATGPQTVPSDGSRARVPIGTISLVDSTQRTLAAPEISLNAIRILDLANSSQQALLPGQVSLYVDGAFLGLTEVDFIAPGEAFELFLGVADQLKLSRSLDRKSSALSRRGERTKMGVAFVLGVENLSSLRTEEVQLRDRIPVSQTDQIRITGVEITPLGHIEDDSGLLSWTIHVAPQETKRFRIEYTIEYPTSLPTSDARDHDKLRMELRSLEERMTG